MSGQQLGGNEVRQSMGRFLTGVAVVTVFQDGKPHGMTVNSLTSVSLDPPLLLVCMAPRARTAQALVSEGRFAVSVLAAGQEHIARRFATPHEDHFAGLELHVSDGGNPHIPGVLASIDCSVHAVHTEGDHVVVLGTMEAATWRDGQPLAFHSGRFGDYEERGTDRLPWRF